MTCGLSKDELDLLYYLVDGRCLSEKHSISQKAIEHNLGPKMNVQEVLKNLMNERLVGCKKKKNYYYWADAGRAIAILREHNYDVPFGNVHKI